MLKTGHYYYFVAAAATTAIAGILHLTLVPNAINFNINNAIFFLVAGTRVQDRSCLLMAIQVVSNFLFDNGLMVIKELKITDQETVSFFKELELTEVEEKIKEILKMGVVAAKTVGTAEKVDYVEKEFNKFDSKIEMMLLT